MATSILDPYFNGVLHTKAAELHPGGELEVEVRIIADDNLRSVKELKSGMLRGEMVDVLKAAIKDILAKKKPSTAVHIENSINWITADYGVNQKLFISDKPQIGSNVYRKSRLFEDIGMDVIMPKGEPHTYGIKLDAQVEKSISPFEHSRITMSRIRSRLVIEDHPLFPGWRIDISGTSTYSGNYESIVSEVKNTTVQLFKGVTTADEFLNGPVWDAAEHIEVEMEWMNTIHCGAVKAFENGPLAFIKFMNPEASSGNPVEFQRTVYDIAKCILPAKSAEAYRRNKGLKQLGVVVSDLGRRVFYTEWRHKASNYTITSKADGDRAEIIGNDEGIRRIGAGFELLSSKAPKMSFIVDGEKLPNGDYYVFDCMYFDGKSICDLPFRERMEAAVLVVKELGAKFFVKRFEWLDGTPGIGGNVDAVKAAVVKSTVAKMARIKAVKLEVAKAVKAAKPTDAIAVKVAGDKKIAAAEGPSPWWQIVHDFSYYKPGYLTDGTVFTPTNTSYFKMIVYKWKPPSHISVDFFITPGDDNTDILEVGTSIHLACGINATSFAAMALRPPKQWGSDSKTLGDYFAVPFMPSVHADAYRYTLTSADIKVLRKHFGTGKVNLSKNVVEMGFMPLTEKDNVPFKFHIMRIRDDRATEIRRGNYFGNDFRIAEVTCMSAMNPLTSDDFRPIEDLERKTGAGGEAADTSGYFTSVNNASYKALRSYGATVKETIWNSYVKNQPSALDLAAGQGQDLRRYMEAGVTHLTALDRDPQAVSEMISRKYSLINGSWVNGKRIHAVEHARTNLRVARVDLAKDTVINELASMGINHNIKIVVCSLAIHYFAETPASVRDFVSIVKHSITTGGKFIFSCFDGERVLALLRANNGRWASDDNRYCIEWAGSGVIPIKLPKTGAKIRTKLPFSDGLLYEEFLMNASYWTSQLQMAGIMRSTLIPYGVSAAAAVLKKTDKPVCLGKQSIREKMNADDKVFSDLYSWYVFVK